MLLKNKILLAALVLLVIVSVALVLANVSAGDEGGGGSHGIIRALLL